MEHGHQYGMGTVMSLLMMAHGVGMMVGPALFGTIASQYGLGSAFWSGGIMGVILILACYVLTNGVPVSQAETEKALETEPVAAD
jgi:MFS family permease